MKFNKTIFLLLLAVAKAHAVSFVYVTDVVDIPLRSSNSIVNNPSNVIRNLPSGTKLRILATENGWTKVRFGQTTGWMISRYLISNPPAREQLEALQQNNDSNKITINKQSTHNSELAKQLKDLKKINTNLSIQVSKAKSEKRHIEQTYKDALKLEYANEKLQKRSLQLQTEIQLLQNNGSGGQDASARNWFIVGALVLFFGFIIGFLFPRRPTKNPGRF
ncbi:MAG: TIGR04211 family SH3 domain-containing protein [Candidatus Thioglobus sp.]|nr:TIGR04211 family SH3 domain-containing protein [Candidatus Thioglobus sp.]